MATVSVRSNVNWCGNCWEKTAWCRFGLFGVFFPSLIAYGTKTRRALVMIFGTLGEFQTLYSNL